MKIYKVSGQALDGTRHRVFAPSEAAAAAARKKLNTEHGILRKQLSTDVINIKTTKAALFDFLNSDYNR